VTDELETVWEMSYGLIYRLYSHIKWREWGKL